MQAVVERLAVAVHQPHRQGGPPAELVDGAYHPENRSLFVAKGHRCTACISFMPSQTLPGVSAARISPPVRRPVTVMVSPKKWFWHRHHPHAWYSAERSAPPCACQVGRSKLTPVGITIAARRRGPGGSPSKRSGPPPARMHLPAQQAHAVFDLREVLVPVLSGRDPAARRCRKTRRWGKAKVVPRVAAALLLKGRDGVSAAPPASALGEGAQRVQPLPEAA